MLRPEKVRCSVELLLANRHHFLLIFGDFLGFRPRKNSGMAPNSCVCRPHSPRLASSKTGLSGTWLYTKVGHTIVRHYASGVGQQTSVQLARPNSARKIHPAGTIWSQPVLKGYTSTVGVCVCVSVNMCTSLTFPWTPLNFTVCATKEPAIYFFLFVHKPFRRIFKAFFDVLPPVVKFHVLDE